MKIGRPPVDPKIRFLSKVEAVESGCHEWQSTLNRGGYGKFYFEGKQEPAHRVSFILFSGSIPAGRWVLHKCDNRKCVNPEHLFLGGAIENIADMDGKSRRGTKCKLTERDAQIVKALLSSGISQQKVADAFGTDQTSISRVKLGKTTRFRKE